jgi:type 1 glutamine amidotransferase
MRFTLLCILFVSSVLATFAAAPTRILIVVGPTDHPPGTHEVAAGARLLKHCLENMANLPGVKVDLFYEWPTDVAVRAAASTVVFMGDSFPPNRLPNAAQNLAELGTIMARGCGLVCVHYATGLLGTDVKPDGDHPLLHWMGGYFAHRSCTHHVSFAKIFPAATITPSAPQHPVWRGCREFTLHDEPYTNNYLGPAGYQLAARSTVLATSLLPPEAPKSEAVSWCIERPDAGRGFAVVMPHFYRNWKLEDLRRYILNGIAWTARLDVPAAGVQTTLPDLSTFGPASIEPLPPAPKAKASRTTK